MRSTGRYAAIAAAALVVDGGIYRHEFVAQAVVNGLMRAGLDTGVPVLSVWLTPHHFREAAPHTENFRAHFVTKGREAAEAALARPAGQPTRSRSAPPPSPRANHMARISRGRFEQSYYATIF